MNSIVLQCASILLFLVLAGCASNSPSEGVSPEAKPSEQGYTGREDVNAFISEMVAEGYDEQTLRQAFSEAKYQQKIIDAISRPAERTLTWSTYQDIFLKDRRVNLGVEFIEEHRDTFLAAEKQYGVPVEVIAAIIGVETLYGRIKGRYRVIDSLATLAFDYPPRSKFFRSELKQFFTLIQEEQQRAQDPVGSYAGAMGYGQFISSSYRHYAVDFDGDGIRDIWNNPVDAIGSVANYLAEHRWAPGDAIVQRASLSDGVAVDPQTFNQSLKPNLTLEQLSKLGVSLTDKSAGPAIEAYSNTIVSPMRLEGKKGDEYWIGFNNFYVITRYNHSKLYAMAVYQLSQQIKEKAKI